MPIHSGSNCGFPFPFKVFTWLQPDCKHCRRWYAAVRLLRIFPNFNCSSVDVTRSTHKPAPGPRIFVAQHCHCTLAPLMTQNYLKYVTVSQSLEQLSRARLCHDWGSSVRAGPVPAVQAVHQLYSPVFLSDFSVFFPSCPPTRHSCPLHWERRIISRFVRLFPRYLILFWIYSRSQAGRALNPSYWIMDIQGGEKCMTCWKCWVLLNVCRIVCPDLCPTSFFIQPPSYINILRMSSCTLRSILVFYQCDKPHCLGGQTAVFRTIAVFLKDK